jgi:hypothetical protein
MVGFGLVFNGFYVGMGNVKKTKILLRRFAVVDFFWNYIRTPDCVLTLFFPVLMQVLVSAVLLHPHTFACKLFH